jgi:peptidoglycan hydrolase CwlO-like protein
VKRFLDEAYQQAVDTLTDHRDLLERLAQALLERETLDRDEIITLAEGRELPAQPTELEQAGALAGPAAPSAAASAEDQKPQEEVGATGEGTRRDRVSAAAEVRRVHPDEAEADAS